MHHSVLKPLSHRCEELGATSQLLSGIPAPCGMQSACHIFVSSCLTQHSHKSSTWPLTAATKKAVMPSFVVASLSARASSYKHTTSAWPLHAATHTCHTAVKRSSTTTSLPAPASSNNLTTFTLPLKEAKHTAAAPDLSALISNCTTCK